MLPTVEESLESLFASASFLDSLPFQTTKRRIADTALAAAEVFEGTYIRDAEEHELGLFSTQDSTSYDGVCAGAIGGSSVNYQSVHERDDRARHRRSLLGRSAGRSNTSRPQHPLNNGSTASRSAWSFPKSTGPARIGAPEKATPLKKRRAAQTAQNKTVADPEAYLLAARKLLQAYPMQRASEHVELLYSQYEGLMDAIADIEETLQQPAPIASTSAMTMEASAEDDVASLEAEIKREELEILALKEARRELDREAKQLNYSKSRETNPVPRQSSRMTSTKSQTSSASIQSLKDISKPVRQTATSTAGTASKRMPSVVARRMAEQKEAAAARSRTSKTPTPPDTSSPAVTEGLAPSMPEVHVQSPSNSSATLPDEAEDEDKTVVIGKDKANAAPAVGGIEGKEADADMTTLSKPQLQPRLPAEQFDKILAKIVSALPGNVKRSLPRDADSVLSALSNTISQAEARVLSSSSRASDTSMTASPTSPTLTPVNIIELHLLHTFLSLLLSLELETSTNSKEKLSLILRKPVSSSTSSALATNEDANGNSLTAAGPAEAFINMNSLKVYLSGKAKGRGLSEDLGHKAIWGLVAKKILKIDRKSREALVGFT